MAFFGTNVVREDLSGYFNGLEGSVVLLDQDRDKFTIYNEKKSRGRVSPDSTFKIYAALIGLENQVLPNANTQFKWDQTIYPIDAWNRDHNLSSAMTYFVNWYFEQVCQRVGEDKMRFSLKRMNFGNGSIRIIFFIMQFRKKSKIGPDLRFPNCDGAELLF
jgi:bla regulator protein BlaR1